MSTQAGSRWQVTKAVLTDLVNNVAAKINDENARLALEVPELEDYPGSGVALQIPPVSSTHIKMDPQAAVSVGMMPAMYLGGLGISTLESAESMDGRLSFGTTPVQVALYVCTSVNYSGTQYTLTEEELIYMAGAFGQAVIDAMRAGGTNSLWQQGAGIVNPQLDTFMINGYVTDDNQNTTAAKVLLTWQITHESRY